MMIERTPNFKLIKKMNNKVFLRRMLWLLCLPLLLTACKDSMDEHYEVPDWVADNAWEVLSSGEHGNYSIFLQGLEIAGYKQMLEGKAILTIIAPDDDAFQTYLNKRGFTSISDMPVNEVSKLIGYHVLYYSYNKEKLVNFRPTGSTETEEEQNIKAGLYYKHRTRSSDAPTVETTPTGASVMVYHLERYLPIFSYRYFQTKGIDAKNNYEAFYPNSTWTGDDGFNVSNASVKEYGIIANNGYIHAVDRVVEPLETIYTELKNKEKYSTFLDLYDSFGVYVADDELSKSYAKAYGVDTLYQYQHGGLPNIACEWPTSSYLNFTALTALSYSIFAPSNTAINSFFDSFWKIGGYSSMQEVDALALNYFLYQFIYGGSMLFPEELGDDELKNLAGSSLNINPAALNEKTMCVNGALYGMDEIKEPSTFASVIGPLFQYKSARSFLYALLGSSLFSSYVSDLSKYIVLVPTAEQFEASGIRTVYSTQGLEAEGDDGWAEISNTAKQNIVYLHSASISSEQSSELPERGTRVIPTESTWNCWFVKDGNITCSSTFNQQLNPQFNGTVFTPFTKLKNGSNGSTYSFDAEQLFAAESGDLAYNIAICADHNYPYYCFAQLLREANLISNQIMMNLFGKGRFVAFIPTNDAIKRALASNKIPGAIDASFDAEGKLSGTFDAKELANYLNSYFITAAQNVIPSYPYIGSDFKSGRYWSERVVQTEGATAPQLIYTDNGTSLSIQLEGGNKCQVVSDYDYFPFAYEGGCFHLIDDVF